MWRGHAAKRLVEDCQPVRSDSFARVLAAREAEGPLRYVAAPHAAPAAAGWWETSAVAGERFLRLRLGGSDREHVVPVVTTKLASGGVRPWFECPGLGCRARVGCLYLPAAPREFRCRRCHSLAYRSGRTSCFSRSLRRRVAASKGLAPRDLVWGTVGPRNPGWVPWPALL